MTSSHLTAADVIAELNLAPHPEGGHFRETFRDPALVTLKDGSGKTRAASTAIYFLLSEGERSRWHKVDAAEVWHWYAGAPLTLGLKDDSDGDARQIELGPDLTSGQRPQAIVPAGIWQNAESSGAWTLVGCSVAPGFQFSGFELEDS